MKIRHIEEVSPVASRRLGRYVHHDPRSLEHAAPKAPRLASIMHHRTVPIFDQGDLGSCTGNAAAGCMGTRPFEHRCTEADAVQIYCEATHLDRILGVYPPDDTGSSGLGVMKALKKRGWIKAYRHAFGLDHALHTLMLGPGITGITWLSGCDSPDKSGVVRYTGAIRGGHEIQLLGLDVDTKLVWFANSWGASWGKGGLFAMSFDDYALALKDDGDATFPQA